MAGEEGQSRTDNQFLGKNISPLEAPDIPSKGDTLNDLLLELAAAETEEKKKKVWRSVLEKCFAIWDFHGIPTTRRCNALKSLRTLHEDFQTMKRIYDRTDSINRMAVLAVFRRKMSKFFLVGAENADTAETCPAHLREPLVEAKIDNRKIGKEEKNAWRRAEASSYDVMPDNNNNDEPMNMPNLENLDLQAPVDQAAIDQAYREAFKDEPELLEAMGLLGDGPTAAAEPEVEGLGVGVAAKNAKTASKPAVKKRRAADVGLDAESSTNHADGIPGLAGADAGQTSPSQVTFVEDRQPSSKKPRLETPMEQDDDTVSSSSSSDGSGSIHQVTVIERPTKTPPFRAEAAETAARDATSTTVTTSFQGISPTRSPQPHRGFQADFKHAALIRAMHVYSTAPEDFHEQLKHIRWPPKSEWSDHELLEAAVGFEYEAITIKLLEAGARAWRDGEAPTTFHRMIELGWIDAVSLSLSGGARVSEKNSDGDTALHVAFSKRKSAEMMGLLARRLDEETSFNVADRDGLSTWHIICGPGSEAALVEAVLSRGFADVNSQVPLTAPSSIAGFTALHFAARYSNVETAKVLLRHGADLHARTATNSTPLHLACAMGWTRLVDELLSRISYKDNPTDDFGVTYFMAACVSSRIKYVENFLAAAESWESKMVMLESKTKEMGPLCGCSPVMLATRFGRTNTARLIQWHLSSVQCQPIANATPEVIAPIIAGIKSVVIQMDDASDNSLELEVL